MTFAGPFCGKIFALKKSYTFHSTPTFRTLKVQRSEALSDFSRILLKRAAFKLIAFNHLYLGLADLFDILSVLNLRQTSGFLDFEALYLTASWLESSSFLKSCTLRSHWTISKVFISDIFLPSRFWRRAVSESQKYVRVLRKFLKIFYCMYYLQWVSILWKSMTTQSNWVSAIWNRAFDFLIQLSISRCFSQNLLLESHGSRKLWTFWQNFRPVFCMWNQANILLLKIFQLAKPFCHQKQPKN